MFEKVCKILSEFTETKAEEMTMETLLLSDLDMDSLDTVNAVVRFEDEFNIEVPDRVIYDFRTIGDIVNYLMKERKG